MNKLICDKIVIVFIILFGVINFLYRGIVQSVSGRKADFSSYYTASLALKNKLNPYNTDVMLETAKKNNSFTLISGDPRVHKYVYPPLLANLLTPLTLIKFSIAKILWTAIINPVLIFLVIYISIKLADGSAQKKIFLFFIIIIFNPVYETIAYGQVNILILLTVILTLYFYKNKQNLLSSACLSIGIFLKIFPIILLIYFLFIKDLKYIFITIAFCLIILAGLILLNGFEINYIYFTNVLIGFAAGAGSGTENLSIFSIFQYFFNNNISTLILYLFVLVILLASFKKYFSINNNSFLFIIVSSIMLLLPKTVWEHHYLLLYVIPVILVLNNFLDNKKIFLSFIIFWAIFSVEYKYFCHFSEYGFLDYFKYVKLFSFIGFIFSMLLFTSSYFASQSDEFSYI